MKNVHLIPTDNPSRCCTVTITDEKGKPLTYWGGLKEPKQEATMKETIEEVAKNYANYNEQINKAVQEAVKFGAKWQQEQDKNKYSEQDLRDCFYDAKTPSYQDFGEWFSQFKKNEQ